MINSHQKKDWSSSRVPTSLAEPGENRWESLTYMAGGVVYTAVVHAPRENVRKRRNEAVRSHLKEFRASIPRQPRRPSLELLEVDHLPPEAELGAVRDWRVAKRARLSQRVTCLVL